MKITEKWLLKNNACNQGIDWFNNQNLRDEIDVINALMEKKRFDWANWYISYRLTKEESLRYAIYAAKSVLNIFETNHPTDTRPRMAVKAAEKYLKYPTEKNKIAATDAAYAATYAAYAADATDAAYAAAYAADAAAYAANAANAAYAAAYAADAADAGTIKTKIIKYGIKLIKGNKKVI